MINQRRPSSGAGNDPPAYGPNLSDDMTQNIRRIRKDFGNSSDLVISTGKSSATATDYAVVYINKLADSEALNAISSELANMASSEVNRSPEELFAHITALTGNIRPTGSGAAFHSLYGEMLQGNTVFLFGKSNVYYFIRTGSGEGRAITEPTSQTIIKGPKEAFTEDIEKNIYQIRKRIKTEALWVEDFKIGSVTNTNVKMVYLNGIVKSDILVDIRNRLSKVNYDGILDSGYIEELIKTDPYSIFPSSLNSERPDAVSGGLLEGRIAILVDGSPFVITVPAIFADFIQASEDYFYSFYVSSLMRIVRYMALFLTLLVPGMFIALTTFHQEIIPTPLLVSIAAQREGIPFPSFLEVLIMELSFEIIREAGIRMPRAIGPAISIVGALVLGQAAVEAGLISSLVVIVVAITAISSFAITNYGLSNAIRLLRFLFIILAAALGLYGISMGMILLVLHLCKIKSAGVPYMTPLAPYLKGANKDTIFRFPLGTQKKRPVFITNNMSDKTTGSVPMDNATKGKQELK